MAVIRIACIVEGHGESGSPGQEGAAPILVRRVAREIDSATPVSIPIVLRRPRDSLVNKGGLEAAVERVARLTGGQASVLVLLDSDDALRESLEADLLERARRTRADLSIAVVAAKYEFEAWFIAAAASLAGCEGLPLDLQPPPNPDEHRKPEEIRGAKEWLAKRMAGGKYLETLHQPKFARRFDLQAARAAPSFEHCYQMIAYLIAKPEQP